MEQAWSNEGETMLVSVESSDKYDNNTLSIDYVHKNSSEELRRAKQVLHRTAANEPLRVVQQTERQR